MLHGRERASSRNLGFFAEQDCLRSHQHSTDPNFALQNYAIVEFAVPYMALKAKRALDDVEASMRPDTSRRAEREAGGRVEQVKLLRSEFAAIKSVQSQFSRTLFVSNLPPVPPLSLHLACTLRACCFQLAASCWRELLAVTPRCPHRHHPMLLTAFGKCLCERDT